MLLEIPKRNTKNEQKTNKQKTKNKNTNINNNTAIDFLNSLWNY